MATNTFYGEEEEKQPSLWGDRHAWFEAVKVKDELAYQVRKLRRYNAMPRFTPQKIQYTAEQFDELQEQVDHDRFVMLNDERQTAF